MNDTLENVVERLDFLDDANTRLKVALSIKDADAPEAAAIHLRGVWKRKENALRTELTAQRRKMNATNTNSPRLSAGIEPAQIPTNRAEFERLSYLERVWLYDCEPTLYRKFTARR